MSTIPDPAGFKRSSIDPSTEVISIGNSGAEGTALAELGQTAGNAASRVARMALYHQDQIDTQRAKEAELKLRSGTLDLQKEFSSMRGIDAYSPKTLEDQQNKFAQLRDSVANEYELSENSLTKYNLAAQAQEINNKSAIFRHAMAEEEKHKISLYKQDMAVSIEEAIATDGNLPELDPIIIKMSLKTEEEMRRNGTYTEDGHKEVMKGYFGDVWAGIVGEKITRGDSSGAYAAIAEAEKRNHLTSKQGIALKKLVKPVRNAGQARAVTDAAIHMVDNDMPYADVLDFIRDSTKGMDPAVYSQANQEVQQHITAKNTDLSERGANFILEYSKGKVSRNSPEFSVLSQKDPILATKLLTAMNQIDNAKITRAAKTTPEQEVTAQLARVAFLDRGMSNKQIIEELETSGPKNKDGRLLGTWRSILGSKKHAELVKEYADDEKSDQAGIKEDVKKYTIPKEWVEAAIPWEIRKIQNKAKREYLIDHFKSLVVTQTKRFINQRGQVPSEEEAKSQILDSLRLEYNTYNPEDGIGDAKLMEAWEVTRGDKMYPVEMEQIIELVDSGLLKKDEDGDVKNPEVLFEAYEWIQDMRYKSPEAPLHLYEATEMWIRKKLSEQEKKEDKSVKPFNVNSTDFWKGK